MPKWHWNWKYVTPRSVNLVPQATEIKNLPLSSYEPEHDYDVVISTVMLPNEQKLIMVHPILTDQDRVAILRNCMATEPQAKNAN